MVCRRLPRIQSSRDGLCGPCSLCPGTLPEEFRAVNRVVPPSEFGGVSDGRTIGLSDGTPSVIRWRLRWRLRWLVRRWRRSGIGRVNVTRGLGPSMVGTTSESEADHDPRDHPPVHARSADRRRCGSRAIDRRRSDSTTGNARAITADAVRLVEKVRAGLSTGMLESFLAEYSLSTTEGIALMCLAEALLRVPDTDTIDDLIEDKIALGALARALRRGQPAAGQRVDAGAHADRRSAPRRRRRACRHGRAASSSASASR